MTRIAFWLFIFAAAGRLTERARNVGRFSLDGLGDPFDIWGDEGDA